MIVKCNHKRLIIKALSYGYRKNEYKHSKRIFKKGKTTIPKS